MNLEALDFSILGPAFLAGLLVLATHVPLGMRVLARGIVFIDLAIAQIAGIGVIAADALGWEGGSLAVQVAALVAAVAGGLLLTWTERHWPDVQEAIIGVTFVVAACLGLLLLAGNPHGGEHLKDLLVGQILWVSPAQLAWAAAVTAVVGGLWWWRGESLGRGAFYVLFALAVTVSVQLVGVYLVFASLIVPALAIRQLSPVRQARAGWLVGAIGYALGLAVSALADLPSGATIVVCLVAVSLGAMPLLRRGVS